MLPGDLSVDRWQQIDALFAEALERPLPERERFLQDATQNDPELRREVQELLESTPPAEAILGESVSQYAEPVLSGLRAELRDREDDVLPTGGRVGPYRIHSELGRGGMGAVYLAERADEAFEKQVALKLVKRGMDTDEVLRRFRYERQILASLEHPNIARLYDGGAADDGRPYLVMEYIQGQPITAHCDERRRTIEERLRLFETVCEAVQFAHRNLVIHRDIKPSNILVDADGTVKLLDFGIAKLLGPPDAEADFQTRAGLRLITPEYASPEQIAGRSVTTASDVYALGVMLYEILTGRRPRDRRSRLAAATSAQAAEAAIERPSSVVERPIPPRPGGLQPPAPQQVAAARGTTPQRLRRRIHGDLDTIAMKALADEPERRYQSAEQLLADVQRYLTERPVLARGESPVYRARKFVRRHRLAVGFSTALAVLAVTFTATTLVQAREVAERRAIAEGRQGQAEQLLGFVLNDLRGKLTSIDRLDVLQDVGTQALEYFTAVPPEELSDQELFNRSEALRLLGQVQYERGIWEEAAATFRESLALAEGLAARDSTQGQWQLGLGASQFWLGELRLRQGDAEGALEHWSRYHDTAERMVRHAPNRLTYQQELSLTHGNMGSAFEALGDRGRAIEEYLASIELKERLVESEPERSEFQSDLANGYNKMAVVLTAEGDLASALEYHRAELAVRQSLIEHEPQNDEQIRLLALAHGYLGELSVATGADDEGLEHVLAARELARTLVERDASNAVWRLDLATSTRLAGVGLMRSGQQTGGLEALESSRALLLELHEGDPGRIDFRLELAKAEIELAAAYRVEGRPELGPPGVRRALDAIEPIRNARPTSAAARRVESEAALELGRAFVGLGRPNDARDAWERALAVIRPAAEESGSIAHLSSMGFALLFLDELEAARPVVDELLRRGYRRSNFLALVREKDLLPTDDR